VRDRHGSGTPREERPGDPGFGGFLRSFFSKIPWHESVHRDEKIRIPAPSGHAIEVHNANGKTRVIGEDREDIEIRVQKSVSADCPDLAEKILDSIQLNNTDSGDVLALEIQIPRRCARRALAHIELLVPRDTRVTLTSTNGKICLEGVERSVKARSSNGSIAIREVTGDIDVATANAKVACRDTCGRLHARSSNGKIEVGGHQGSLDAATSNGVIRASLEALGADGVVLATSNGRIVLELPEEPDAEVDIEVENGLIRNDLELEDEAGDKSGRVRGRLGKGGTPIKLRTSNGTISLR